MIYDMSFVCLARHSSTNTQGGMTVDSAMIPGVILGRVDTMSLA